jgi:hypothetical protein
VHASIPSPKVSLSTWVWPSIHPAGWIPMDPSCFRLLVGEATQGIDQTRLQDTLLSPCM